MALFNVRISGQIEAESAQAATIAIAGHITDPERTANPMKDGGLLRIVPDPSDLVACAEHALAEAERAAAMAREQTTQQVLAAREALEAAKRAAVEKAEA